MKPYVCERFIQIFVQFKQPLPLPQFVRTGHCNRILHVPFRIYDAINSMVDEKRGRINKTLMLLNKQLETVDDVSINEEKFANESILNAAKTISVKGIDFLNNSLGLIIISQLFIYHQFIDKKVKFKIRNFLIFVYSKILANVLSVNGCVILASIQTFK